MRALVLVVVLLVPALAAGSPALAPAGPARQSGYLPMEDGVLLRYSVVLPDALGRFPVALVYDGYGDGADPLGPTANEPALASALLARGYAVMGVNVRGTGCSGGRFDVLDPQWARDGARVVEWAAAQPWSTGHVGMFGYSFPGIASLLVAAQHPPHLDAIAPGQVTADFYRDTLHPGGIYNEGFTKAWTAILAAQGDPPAGVANDGPDATCAANMAQSALANPATAPAVELPKHAYLDAWMEARSPIAAAREVRVPALASVAWQDDALGGRQGSFYWSLLPNATTWIVATNGYHGALELVPSPYYGMLGAFFDRYLRGDANGWESTPRLTLWHESTADAACTLTQPGFVTSSDWPPALHAVEFHLGAGGALADATVSGAPDAYAYPAPAPFGESGVLPGMCESVNEPAWQARDAPGGFVAYTSAPFARDAELFGPASADLWLTSTAPDTDVQVTLTEVRPDGQEMRLQSGWLRLSHRALDEANSTPLRPLHTDLAQDARPLAPGEPTFARVEVFPFDHVVRAGSRLRLDVEAPTGVLGDVWRLDYLKTPAANAVLHDAAHDSVLRVGVLDAAPPAGGLSPCGQVLGMPCRPDVGAPEPVDPAND